MTKPFAIPTRDDFGDDVMSDALDLDALEALEKAATPGPWVLGGEFGSAGQRLLAQMGPVTVCPIVANGTAEATFIIALRNAAPALIAAAKRAKELDAPWFEKHSPLRKAWQELAELRAIVAQRSGEP